MMCVSYVVRRHACDACLEIKLKPKSLKPHGGVKVKNRRWRSFPVKLACAKVEVP